MQPRPHRPAASCRRPNDMAAARPTSHARGLSVQQDGQARVLRTLPEEVPVAVVCNGNTHAVMMATPGDLSDFATGFALTEGLIETLDEIEQIEIVEQEKGIEARLWMTAPRATALAVLRDAIMLASMDHNFSLPERERIYTFAARMGISRRDLEHLEAWLGEYRDLRTRWNGLVAGAF